MSEYDPCCQEYYIDPCCQEPEDECEEEEEVEEEENKNVRAGKKDRSKRRSKDREGEEEDDEEEERPKKKRHRHSHGRHRRSKEEAYQMPPEPGAVKMGEEEKSACQCDLIVFMLLVNYILAIAVFALGICYYLEDSRWNDVVNFQETLPVLDNPETFFSEKYLYLEELDPYLKHLKAHLYRGARAKELMHLIFFGSFIFLTTFQIILYATRGKADHSRVLICYYSVFGGLGLLMAVFPQLSLVEIRDDYDLSLESMRNFQNNSALNVSTVNHGTKNDIEILHKVISLCKEVGGFAFLDSAPLEVSLFNHSYTVEELQTLGFCTNVSGRLIAILLGYLVAIICCVIPCAKCMNTGDEPVADGQTMEGGDQLKMMEYGNSPPTTYYDNEGNPLTPQQAKLIEKFKRYVLGQGLPDK